MACPYVRKAASEAKKKETRTAMANLKFLQWNGGKGREAEDAMRAWADDNDIQVVLVQEPFGGMSTWPNWKWYKANGKAKTTTWVRSNIKATLNESLSTNNLTWMAIWNNGQEFSIVNVYDEPPGAMQPSRWRNVIGALQLKQPHSLVVAGDLNAKHGMGVACRRRSRKRNYG